MMKVEHEAMTMRIANKCASSEEKSSLPEKLPTTMAEHIDDGYASSDGSSMILQKLQAPPQVSVVQPCHNIASSSKRSTTSTRMLRPISYPPAASNTLSSTGQSSRQLRALLLPDLVRAKGGRLISTSEIASLQRVRSVSDSMDYSSISRKGQGIGYGHRRTFSLPGLRHSNENSELGEEDTLNDSEVEDEDNLSRLKEDVIIEDPQQGRLQKMEMRDSDLDTFDEPYDLVMDFDEYEILDPPMAGYGYSFRDYMYDDVDDCGNSSKPLVIVFRPFLSTGSSYDDDKQLEDEGAEEIMIEAWAVDGNGNVFRCRSTSMMQSRRILMK